MSASIPHDMLGSDQDRHTPLSCVHICPAYTATFPGPARYPLPHKSCVSAKLLASAGYSRTYSARIRLSRHLTFLLPIYTSRQWRWVFSAGGGRRAYERNMDLDWRVQKDSIQGSTCRAGAAGWVSSKASSHTVCFRL